MRLRGVRFPIAFLAALASQSGTAEQNCNFDPAAVLRLEPPEQCAVRALSDTCDKLHHCYAACLVEGTGENVGGGCAHICGIIERSHAYYDCYPGLRDEMDAMMTYFVILNDSNEKIRVTLHYEKASNHKIRALSECLHVELKLAPREQLGEDSYLVDNQRRVLVESLEPKLKGTALRCTTTVEIPPGKLLLHGTSYGYWFSELNQVHVRTSTSSYTFSHDDVPRYDAPAESVYRWYLWRHPYDRAP
jgi:hypothetical protein